MLHQALKFKSEIIMLHKHLVNAILNLLVKEKGANKSLRNLVKRLKDELIAHSILLPEIPKDLESERVFLLIAIYFP